MQCPVCDSKEVGPTGGSYQIQGMQRNIGLECYKCGAKFRIFESDYKP